MTDRRLINVFEPGLGEDEVEAVRTVFQSGWIGRGRKTADFEAAFAAHLGVDAEHLISTTCATEALFVTMELLELGPGDEVILPTISFVGAANAVAARGATAVFCDVDRRTLNPTAAQVEAKLSSRTRAILPLHYGGWPGEIEAIAALAHDRGIALVEDAACAVASTASGTACGVFGDFGAWSFDAMKILVTGDGGMLYVRDRELATRARRLTYLGLEEATGFASAGQKERWWEFDISSFSRRAIGNDMTSAIGLVQLGKLADNINRRRAIHEHYDELLADVAWLARPDPPTQGMDSSYYFYWVQAEDEADRDRLAVCLRDCGVYSTFRYYPLHKVALYGSTEHLAEAEAAASQTLLLPLHQGLTTEDVEHVVDAVRSYHR